MEQDDDDSTLNDDGEDFIPKLDHKTDLVNVFNYNKSGLKDIIYKFVADASKFKSLSLSLISSLSLDLVLKLLSQYSFLYRGKVPFQIEEFYNYRIFTIHNFNLIESSIFKTNYDENDSVFKTIDINDNFLTLVMNIVNNNWIHNSKDALVNSCNKYDKSFSLNESFGELFNLMDKILDRKEKNFH